MVRSRLQTELFKKKPETDTAPGPCEKKGKFLNGEAEIGEEGGGNRVWIAGTRDGKRTGGGKVWER